jgi:pilus assembly protein CpaF
MIPPRLQELLERPEVTDLCFNRFDQFFIDRGNGLEAISGEEIFQNEGEYRTFVLEQISLSGKTWDAKLPFLDTVFFQTHRAHISFPPLAQFGIYLSLRRLPKPQTMNVDRWKDSAKAMTILIQAIQNHETMIIAGGTGSGKTTLLNDLLSYVPATERMIALEDTSEIHPSHPHFLSLLSRTQNADGFGAVTLRDLLRQTLRMRPDRILVGECRGDEVLDLLQALNTGHRGTLGTIHANSARDALRRIELLALIAAKGTVPSPLIKELMAHGIQKLVFMERMNGVRRIHTILQIEGREREIIFTRPVFSIEETSGAHASFRTPATV